MPPEAGPQQRTVVRQLRQIGNINTTASNSVCIRELIEYLKKLSSETEAMGVWRCWRRGQLKHLCGGDDDHSDRPIGNNFNKMG
eukprot:10493236-Lingulodinium_polyedra.AAC.1